MLCTHENGEVRHCWNYSGNGGGGIKENNGGSEFKYYICKIYYKNFCKCHNVPLALQ
jgi:hypothetical protein